MAALPPVPGVIKLEFLWSQSGIPAANIFHAGYSGGPPTAADLATFGAAAGAAFWGGSTLGLFPSTLELVGVKATDLASDSGAVAEVPIGTSGTGTGGECPAQAAVLVNYSISRRYRGGHPRTYFPPFEVTNLASPSEWSAGATTDLDTAIAALFSYADGVVLDSFTGTGLVCVSYELAKVPRDDPLVEPIAGWVVNPILGTQRRRVRASSY
jgi:hypothetical protein